MKFKRYVAADIRQAIRMVREEQGPDAVILSNKRIDKGVELIAAVDYEQSLDANKYIQPAPTMLQKNKIPQSESIVNPKIIKQTKSIQANKPGFEKNNQSHPERALKQVQSEIRNLRNLLENQISGQIWSNTPAAKPVRVRLLRKLIALGLASDICKRIVGEVSASSTEDQAWRLALDMLTNKIPIGSDIDFKKGGIIALMGSTGVGKTTTIAKIASRYALHHDHRRISLITADNYRVGGQEQLKIYSRILGIPIQCVKSQAEFEDIIKNQLADSLVLVDTAGAQTRQISPKRQYEFLYNSSVKIRNFLVLSATSQRSDLEESIKAFDQMHIQGCVITKMDECTNLGGLLSVITKNRLPVIYTSEGQRVPEDLNQAVATSLVSKCVALARNHQTRTGDDGVALEYGERSSDDSN